MLEASPPPQPSVRVRRLLMLYLVLVVFDGALRKWVLQDWSNVIFVAKDFVLFAAYVVAISTPYKRSDGLRNANAFLLAMLGLFLALWLRDANSLRALAGLKYYVACLPLIFLVPYVLQSGDLDRIGWLLVRMSTVVCLVGIVQYLSPLDSEINRYAWRSSGDSDIASFAVEDSLSDAVSRVRITGTFSYIATMGAFLLTMVPVVWVMLIKERQLWRRLELGAVFALLITSILMNGSRAPLLIAAVISIPFAFVALRRGSAPLLLALGAALLVTVIGWTSVFSEAYENFSTRVADSGDASRRISGFLWEPLQTMEDYGIVGLGIGSTFGATSELSGLKDNEYAHDDIEHDKVGVELGSVVYFLIIAAKIWFAAATLHLLFRVDRSRAILLWVLLSLTIQVSSGLTIPFHNSVASAAYFFAAGLYFYLRMQWAESRAAAREARFAAKFARQAIAR